LVYEIKLKVELQKTAAAAAAAAVPTTDSMRHSITGINYISSMPGSKA
jgi:hypothetical protein